MLCSCYSDVTLCFFIQLIQENDKTEETAANAASNKKASSDSEEEEQDVQQKDKSGVSNKKKKVKHCAFFIVFGWIFVVISQHGANLLHS